MRRQNHAGCLSFALHTGYRATSTVQSDFVYCLFSVESVIDDYVVFVHACWGQVTAPELRGGMVISGQDADCMSLFFSSHIMNALGERDFKI